MSGIDLTKSQKLNDHAYVTPKGRLSYAQYLIDGSTNDQGIHRYNATLMFPPGSDFTALRKAMGPIALKHCDGDKDAAKRAVERRFLDPMNPSGTGKPAEAIFEGWTMLRLSGKTRPDFVAPNGKVFSLEEAKNEVYSGRWARVTCNPYWFKTGSNKGITLGLQNVQMLDHDENLGGGKPSADGQFGTVDGIEDTQPDKEPSSKESDVDDLFS